MSRVSTEVATRLELTDVTERGDAVGGRFSGIDVTIEAHGELRTLRLALERAFEWHSVGPRIREINDPDVVVTGNDRFDDTITVLAHNGFAPKVTPIFRSPQVRTNLLELLTRFPLAELRGGELVIQSLGHHETQAALAAGTRLIRSLQVAIDEAPEAALEAPPIIGPDFEADRAARDRKISAVGSFVVAVLSIVGFVLVCNRHPSMKAAGVVALVAGALVVYLINRGSGSDDV